SCSRHQASLAIAERSLPGVARRAKPGLVAASFALASHLFPFLAAPCPDLIRGKAGHSNRAFREGVGGPSKIWVQPPFSAGIPPIQKFCTEPTLFIRISQFEC